MLNEDNDDDADQVTGTLDLSKYAKERGRSLPLAVLKRALGRHFNRFQTAVAVCAVIQVPNSKWTSPIQSAARMLGEWATVFDGSASASYRNTAEAMAIEALAKGGRVLVVATGPTVPNSMMAAADIVVDITGLSLADVKRTIRDVTGGRPRDLLEEDVADLDILEATAAIRVGTTAASCIERIRALKNRPSTKGMVVDAPLLSELHGYGAAAAWAERLMSDLDRWRAGEIVFDSIQHNIVLGGPPGVGKTSFVRSLARTAGLPLVVTSMGTLFSTTAGYLDSVTKGIDKVFSDARAAGPCAIVFLDELEAIPNRSLLESQHVAWWTTVVTHFLTVLDGGSTAASNLVVIGATNYPEKLDPALVRPGRLDRVVWIDVPSEADLAKIYRYYLGDDLANEELTAIAGLATGATGAVARGHVIGARSRARSEGRSMTRSDLLDQIFPPLDLPADLAWRAAVHEAGHAVLAAKLQVATVKSISIGGRGSGGEQIGGRVTVERPALYIGSAETLRAEALQILGGRAAEEVVLGSASAGAGGADDSDLARVTGIVASMHLSFGLMDTLSYVARAESALVAARQNPVVMRQVEHELQKLFGQAKALVEKERAAITTVAHELMRDRVMSGARLGQILEHASEFPGGVLNA